jgi:hypothetical protein
MSTMTLQHFSDRPDIEVFHPHVAKTSRNQAEAFVWAIDDWHAPMYYVPRDCPRACFWVGERTSAHDRERWLNGLAPRFVMVVEATWIERINRAQLFRYVMPESSFVPTDDDSGHFVSRDSIRPLRVEAISDLIGAILAADVELRIVERIGPMWRRVHQASTLHFSGTRLRNALGYPDEFGADN